jgi:CxxC-x17-CxxC domain-containing protein
MSIERGLVPVDRAMMLPSLTGRSVQAAGLPVEEVRVPELVDRQLQCCSCGKKFLFSADEQRVFQDRGFSEPRRCRECRDHRRIHSDDGEGAVYHAPAQDPPGIPRPPGECQRAKTPRVITNVQLQEWRRERPLFEAVCSRCGQIAFVPFRPTEGRQVLCRICFREGEQHSSSPAPRSRLV